jgi:hypothetical protein
MSLDILNGDVRPDAKDIGYDPPAPLADFV